MWIPSLTVMLENYVTELGVELHIDRTDMVDPSYISIRCLDSTIDILKESFKWINEIEKCDTVVSLVD